MRKMSRQMPEEFERWVDASIYSQKASEIIGNFKDVIFPLEKTKNKTTLENMWKYINMVCTCMLAVRIVTDGLRRTTRASPGRTSTSYGASKTL